MFPTKVVANIKTHISRSANFLSLENRVVDEIMWKNTVHLDRPQMTLW